MYDDKPSPIQWARWPTRLVLLLLACCGFYGSYRAVHLSITTDETGLLDCIHRSSYKHVLLADDWDPQGHWLPWNPEAHFLNVLLAKPCVELLPFHEIVASRFPSLLGLGLFLWGVWRIGRQFPTGITRVLITVALLSNAFLLDFFGISRGYGLALGFTVLSLSFLCQSFLNSDSDESARRQASIAVWLAFGAALSNLGFLHFYVALLATSLWPRWKNCLKVSWWGSALLLGIFYTPRVLAARSQGLLYFGDDNGFVQDTAGSLVRATFYDWSVSPELVRWMSGGLALLVLLLAYWSHRERIRAAFTLSVVCVLVAVLCTTAHMLLDVKYPEQRAVLFLVPVVTLTLGIVAAWSRHRWLRILLWGLLLAFAGIGLKGANLSHTSTERPGADIPSVMLALQEIHHQSGRTVLVAISHSMKSTVWYYAEHLLGLHLKPGTSGNAYLRGFDWLTVYEWRELLPYFNLPPDQPLLPGTTYLVLDHDDQRFLTARLGGLIPLQLYPASDVELYKLAVAVPGHTVVVTYPGGRKYVGEIADGMENGQGILTLTDGRRYVGEFRDGLANGQGTLTFPDHRQFVGEFKDGAPVGQGTILWPNGAKYVGEIHNGQRDGLGKMTHPNGEVQDGLWKQGKFVGPAH